MAAETIDREEESTSYTTVSEIWPGRFELVVENQAPDVQTTTTHRFETPQLETLREQIETALVESSHR